LTLRPRLWIVCGFPEGYAFPKTGSGGSLPELNPLGAYP
jgi:hypothetical protein